MNANPTSTAIRLRGGNFLTRLVNRVFRFRAGFAAAIAISPVLFLCPAARAQGLQSFLKIDGIEGDSTVKGREGLIDILGFASGVQIDAPAAGGSGGASGKPQFYQIVVSKNVDSASPLLMVNCATGKRFKSATLSVAKVTSKSTKDFFKIVLTNPVITKVETSISSGSSDKLTESVELSFDTIQWTVKTTDAKGKSITTTGGYDIAKGIKL